MFVDNKVYIVSDGERTLVFKDEDKARDVAVVFDAGVTVAPMIDLKDVIDKYIEKYE
jgi:hypothetical protein